MAQFEGTPGKHAGGGERQEASVADEDVPSTSRVAFAQASERNREQAAHERGEHQCGDQDRGNPLAGPAERIVADDERCDEGRGGGYGHERDQQRPCQCSSLSAVERPARANKVELVAKLLSDHRRPSVPTLLRPTHGA